MKNKNLFSSVSLTSFNRGISSILGFMRDMLYASLFGANSNYDAFIIASHIPSFITYVITEAGLTQTLTPLLSEKQMLSNSQKLKLFMASVLGALLILLLLTVVISFFFAPTIISLFAPGFSNEKYKLAVFLLQVLSISILFSTIASYQSTILNSFGYYGLPSSMPIVFNICMLAAALFLTRFFNIPLYALAAGIIFSGIVQVILQSLFLQKKQLLIKPTFSVQALRFRKLSKLILPALFGVSIMQMGVMIDLIFGSYLPGGSVTWLYYSARVMELPVMLCSVGIATVILPNLGRSHAVKNTDYFQSLMDWSIQLALIAGIPAGLGLFFLSNPIIITLFNHGEFHHYDALMTAKSTQAFSIAVIGLIFTKIGATGFYAKQNLFLPAKIAAISVAMNIILNCILVTKFLHVGLALSTAVSSVTNAGILFYFLIKKKYYHLKKSMLRILMKSVTAGTIMSGLLLLLTPSLKTWLNATVAWRIEHLSFILVASIAVYFITLYMIGFQFKDILTAHLFTQKPSDTNFNDITTPETENDLKIREITAQH